MAEPAVTKKPTTYVVLKSEQPNSYVVLGETDQANARAAVQQFAGEKEGRFLAVPLTSFNLFDAQVTQPPPVFRLTEASEQRPAGHSVKAPDDPPPPRDPVKTLGGTLAEPLPEITAGDPSEHLEQGKPLIDPTKPRSHPINNPE